MFPGPDEGAPAHQLLGPQRLVIGQAKFPQRNFDIRLLRGDGMRWLLQAASLPRPAMIALEILFPIFRLQKPVLDGIGAQVYGAAPAGFER
jgi:hypothetical protein